MSKTEAVTDLVLEIFRLNGALIAAGDRLVSDLGLTSARWQVLGAIALLREPAPVVRIAESMGLARQSVQRVVDELAAEGVLTFAENPHHRRAKLVLLTERGRALYAAAERRQSPWATDLGADATLKDIAAASQTLRTLRARLDQDRIDGGSE
jgi:DNA-binding MarR family transcriptional regulator